MYAPDKPSHAVASPVISEIRAHLDTGRGGNHSDEAFIAAIGPGARSAEFRSMRDIIDIGSFVDSLFKESDAPGLTQDERCAVAAE